MGRLTKEEQKRRAELLARGLKICNECHEVLPIEQFSKCTANNDGLQNKCRECNNISSKQYYEENKEERQQHDKQYYEENKEKRQQHYQQYHQTPQGQIVAFNNNTKRRKREEEQGAGINKEQWLEMMNFFNWKCAYSGKSLGVKNNRSIDHIIPLVKGGEHEVWNCVPMDKSLNSSKNDTDIMEWYTAQDFYDEERLDKIYEWQQYAYNKWSNTKEAQ